MASNGDLDALRLPTSDGGSLLVQSRGGGGHRLVFVHGMGATHRTWQRVVADFDWGEAHLVTYDQRGHGGSSAGRAGFPFERLILDLEELVAGDGNPAPTTLVGHSMGSAVVAAYLAWKKPTCVVGAVLTSPVVAAPRRPVERVAASFAASPMVDRLLATGWGRKLVLGSLVGPAADAAAREIVVADMRKAAHRREVTDGLAGMDLHARLSDIAVPVRLASGGNDRAIAESKVRTIAAGLPGASVRIVDRCGHFLPLEQPEVVCEEIAVLHAGRH